MKTKNNLTSLDGIIENEYGKKGTKKREEFEIGYQEFKIGTMLHEARVAKGLTQIELANKCGTTKAYISRVENSLKDVRISTLKNIIEKGLDGHLELKIIF